MGGVAGGSIGEPFNRPLTAHFIGGCTIILPGVEICDNCVIGAGTVITKSIPSGSIAAGNPAKVVRSGIEVGPYGRFANADAIEADLAAAFEGGAG